MIAEISAAVSGLKSAFEITKGLNSVADAVALNDAKISLQRTILEAQQALLGAQETQATHLSRVDQLEKEIVSLKDWSAEKQRYELTDAGQGNIAYRLKANVQVSEPPHLICPQCYEDGKKSILKHDVIPVGRAQALSCNRCGLEMITSGARRGPPPAVSGRSRGR